MASAHNNIGVTGNGYQDIFVAKINSTGNWEWAKSAGGFGYATPVSMVGLSGGSALVTGWFGSQGATFGLQGITNAGTNDIFVAKIGSTGNWEWARSAGGVDDDNPVSMVGLSDGSALVTGYFGSPGATFGLQGITSNGDNDIFVAKIGSTGNWEWAASAGGVSYDEPITMVGLSGGSALVTGWFGSQGATFGSRGITNSGGNNGSADIFVAKIGSTGNWEWAASAGGVGDDRPVSVVGLGDGSALVTGYFTGSSATFYSTSVDPPGDVHADPGFLIAALQSRYRYRVVRKSRHSILI